VLILIPGNMNDVISASKSVHRMALPQSIVKRRRMLNTIIAGFSLV
jgi:hypothetical protein